ncbi:hypothetical protein ACTXT7_014449, partial [Hymenolepis weldensis]
MPRCRSLGVMIDTCLGIYVKTRKNTTRPPVDTIVEMLSDEDSVRIQGARYAQTAY